MFQIIRILAVMLVMVAKTSFAASPAPIEPRTLTWHIVSDTEMSRICRQHGLRPNCEGMAGWDKEFRGCVIWTRSPRGSDDMQRWQIVHHELKHCQDGHFHR